MRDDKEGGVRPRRALERSYKKRKKPCWMQAQCHFLFLALFPDCRRCLTNTDQRNQQIQLGDGVGKFCPGQSEGWTTNPTRGTPITMQMPWSQGSPSFPWSLGLPFSTEMGSSPAFSSLLEASFLNNARSTRSNFLSPHEASPDPSRTVGLPTSCLWEYFFADSVPVLQDPHHVSSEDLHFISSE